MQGSKLLELLRGFSAAQWRRFEAFVQSPYFNKREDLCALYAYLTPFFPEFEHPRLNRSEVKAHWPLDEGPDERRLTYLMNQFHGLAEQFLAVESLMADPRKSDSLLLEHYRRSGMRRHFNGTLERMRKRLSSAAYQDLTYYERQFEMAWQAYLASEDPHRHQYNPRLQEAVQGLDAWYLAHKLRFLCEIASQERILAVQYESRLGIVDLETGIPNKFIESEPALALYYFAWRMTYRDELNDFEHYGELLERHVHLLPPAEQKVLYTLALNFCTRRINQFNEHNFYSKYLEINEKLLQPAMFSEEEELPPWHFLNLVNAGIKAKRMEWTYQFIQRWHNRLPPAYTENLNAYALAYLHYAQQQYGPAQKALAKVEFDDMMLSLIARGLQIRIYFEADEPDLLFAALEAARVYLLRNDRIESQRRRQMQHFIEFTRRMAKIYPPEPGKYQKILDALPPAQELLYRDWLVEQLENRLR